MEYYHVSVMLKEVLFYLNVFPGGIYVDGTVGGGGHSREILEHSQPGGVLIGLDRDPAALSAAAQKLEGRNKFFLRQANFKYIKEILYGLGYQKVNGVLFDLGVSSYQLSEAGRGFTYSHEAPLDMRFDPKSSKTAEELVNDLPAKELASLIRRYGEERWAKRIAEFIVRERKNKAISTTSELVEIIKKAIPAAARRTGPHPAKRTFQALRIAVNEELDAINEGIRAAVELLVPGGRLVVISFHSLEDRIVKNVFKELSRGCVCPPDLPVCRCGKEPLLRLLARKPVLPTKQEVEINPRSRSAKLRAVEKLPSGG